MLTWGGVPVNFPRFGSIATHAGIASLLYCSKEYVIAAPVVEQVRSGTKSSDIPFLTTAVSGLSFGIIFVLQLAEVLLRNVMVELTTRFSVVKVFVDSTVRVTEPEVME